MSHEKLGRESMIAPTMWNELERGNRNDGIETELKVQMNER